MPFPDNIIAYAGGSNEYPSTSYALWKGGHLLVIQVDCLAPPNTVRNPKTELELEKRYFDILEEIHSIIDTIEFERTNLAYLTLGPRGYRLVQKQKTFSACTITPWAPFIDESEIKWKKFVLDCEYRVGEWKGREVDAFCIWDKSSWERLNMMMYNYRTLEGFDLTFNVLGHLVRSGTIIGLVTEPAVGREIKPEDRSLVYKAVAKLQKCGFLLNGILGRMIISERKLRLIFLDFRMVTLYPPEQRAELDALAEENHWGELRRLFLNPTNFYSHWPAVRSSRHGCKILSRIPSPERPLFNAKCIFMILCNSYHDQWQYYRRRTQRTVLSSSKSSNVIVSSSSVTPVENNSDSGLSSNESTPIIPARHLARRQHFRPYYIPI